MLKKFFSFAFTIILIPLSAMAISLSELENNPERYVLAYKDKKDTVYVDKTSIESSPFVKPDFGFISGIVYNVSAEKLRIKVHYMCFHVFYADSYLSIYSQISQKSPHLTEELISTLAMKQIFNFSGIVALHDQSDTFTFDGTNCYDSEDHLNMFLKVPYPSPMCSSANCMFALDPQNKDHEDFTLKAPGQPY